MQGLRAVLRSGLCAVSRACVHFAHWVATVCSLCYQMNRTLQQVRRIRRNTIHHQYFMVELENMEKYAKGRASSDDRIVQNVLPWRRED